ncbi:MAG: hypothetical protein B6241_15015 [Spirochaetaceae bacterium 4572_59]|nr:MAG: hypothetical protein B6241_15015 [Spirochaetaceae bacterium 4572_59]
MLIYDSRVEKKIWKPSKYFHLGAIGLFPFLLFTILSFYSLKDFKRDNSLNSDFPENHKILENIKNQKAHFLNHGDFILLSSPEFNELSVHSLKLMEDLSKSLEKVPTVGSIVSPLNLQDLYDDGYSFSFKPLLDLPVNNQTEVTSLFHTISETKLFRKLFLGKKGTPGLYIFPSEDCDSEEFGKSILEWEEKNAFVVYMTGLPILKFYNSRMTHNDSKVLPLLALILMLMIEYLIYRKVKIAFYLCLGSLIPMIWALSLFPVINLTMTNDNLIAPILVLGLASSYGIHLIRGRSVFPDTDMAGVLDKISGKIIIAGLTTMMGFASLFLSPTISIRQFGFILIMGIIFALIFSLYALPTILMKIPPPTDHGQRMMNHLHRPTGKRKNLIVFSILLLVLGWGVSMVYMDSRIMNLLPNYHPYHQSNSYFNQYFGGVDEIEIFCDSGEEYGIISEEYYKSVSRVLSELESLPTISSAIAYTDFISWMHSRIAVGEDKPFDVSEPDQFFIGESLELLTDSSTQGLQINSLVDPSYRNHRILIRFASRPDHGGWNEYKRMLDDLNLILSKSKIGIYTMGGASIIQYYLIHSHKQTILKGLALFFPILILICLVLTRSIIWTMCIVSSPMLGALVYFGVMGMTGIPLTIPTLLAITCILGVSVDDNIFYTLSMRSKLIEGKPFKGALIESYNETGGAIMDTSVVIIFVMLCLFASGNKAIAQSGFLIITSQSVVTVYTLWFLPMFFPRYLRSKSCIKKEL